MGFGTTWSQVELPAFSGLFSGPESGRGRLRGVDQAARGGSGFAGLGVDSEEL